MPSSAPSSSPTSSGSASSGMSAGGPQSFSSGSVSASASSDGSSPPAIPASSLSWGGVSRPRSSSSPMRRLHLLVERLQHLLHLLVHDRLQHALPHAPDRAEHA